MEEDQWPSSLKYGTDKTRQDKIKIANALQLSYLLYYGVTKRHTNAFQIQSLKSAPTTFQSIYRSIQVNPITLATPTPFSCHSKENIDRLNLVVN